MSKLSQANRALSDKQFAKAVSLYLEILQANPALSEIINGNLKIAQRKFKVERGGSLRQQVPVCGWELGQNAGGRVYTLATLYELLPFNISRFVTLIIRGSEKNELWDNR